MKFPIFNFQFPIRPVAASPRRLFSHTRIFILVLLAAASLAAALRFLSAARAAARPRVSITPLSYETVGDTEPYLRVRIAITNTGHIALTYNPMNFCDDAWLRTESPRGWTNRDIQPGLAVPALISILRPGTRTTRFIRLPTDTLRWQVGYTIQNASTRQRLFASLSPKWFARLYPCRRFLPDRQGPKQAVQSVVFELPQNEPLAMRGWTSPGFSSEPAWFVPELSPHP